MRIIGATFESTAKEVYVEKDSIKLKIENTERGLRITAEQGKIDGRYENMIEINKNG